MTDIIAPHVSTTVVVVVVVVVVGVVVVVLTLTHKTMKSVVAGQALSYSGVWKKYLGSKTEANTKTTSILYSTTTDTREAKRRLLIADENLNSTGRYDVVHTSTRTA